MQEMTPYKKKSYWYVYLIVIVALLFLVGVFCIPSFLSSTSGKNLIQKSLSKKLDGSVEIEKVDFSWFHSQKIEGFDYESRDRSTSFSFEELSIQENLLALLTGSRGKALTNLKEPVLKVNLSSKLFNETRNDRSSFLALLLQNTHIEDGYLNIVGREKQNVQYTNLFLDLLIHDKKNLTFYTRAKTQYNETAGNFEFKGKVDTEKDLMPFIKKKAFKKILSLVDYEVQLFAKNLPTLGLDEFFTLRGDEEGGLVKELFGPLLNIDGNTVIKKDTLHLDVNLQSQNLNLTTQTKQIPGFITLAKPSSVSLTLTPKIFSKLHSLTKYGEFLKLTKAGGVQFILDSIKVPTNKDGINYKNVEYQARLFSSALNLIAKDLEKPITVSSLKVNSSNKGIKDPFALSLQCSVNYLGKNPSHINTAFNINKLTHEVTGEQIFVLTDLNLNLTKFPLAFVDALFTEDNNLVTFLGETISANIRSVTHPQRVQYFCSLDTPRLHIPDIVASVDDSLYLERPAKLSYIPNHSFIKDLIDTPYFSVGHIDKFTGQIEALGLSISDFKDSLFQKLVFQANLFSNALDIDSSFLFGKFIFDKLRFDIHADSIQQVKVGIHTNLEYNKINKSERVAWGEPLATTLNAVVDLSDLQNVQIPSIKGQSRSDRTKIDFDLALDDSFTKLRFVSPLAVEILPTSEIINMIFRTPSKFITYVPYIPIDATFSAQPISLNKPIFEDLAFTADLSLKKIDIVNKEWYREFSFLDSKAHVEANSKKGKFSCDFLTRASTREETAGIIKAKLTSNGFTSSDFLRKDMNLQITAQDFFTQLVDSLLGFNNKLSDIIGRKFDLNLDIAETDMHFEVQKEFNSPNLYVLGEFSITPTSLEIRKKDFKINYLLTKEGYAGLENVLGETNDKNTDFELTYATLMHLKLKNLYWPLPFQKPKKNDPLFAKQLVNEINYNLRNSQFDLDAKIDNVIFSSLGETKVTSLEDLRLELTKNDVTSPFIFNLSSEVKEKTKDINSPKGSIAAAGTMVSKMDHEDNSVLHTKINAKLTHLPTMLLDSFFQMTTKANITPSVLLGDTINATLETKLEDLSGFIDFDIKSDESKANFNAFLNDGVVKLSKPIKASFKVTKKLADSLLKNMNISLEEAKNPLEIYVQDKGFYFPLDPFDLKKIQVRYASANLGQIICKNLGSPSEVGGFFKLNLANSSKIYLWFAPMDFSISNGYMHIDRTELLFDRAYQVCYWGRVNLMRQYVDMTLGLTEQSLRKALGIRGLPRSFVLQVPMEGPIGNVKINKELATTRIAFLLAKSSGITKQSGIWGGAIDMLGDLANDQSSVPPPKPPFPWETALNELEQKIERDSTVQILK